MEPNERQYIYTDEVDYAATADSSVWGTEDKVTGDLLDRSDLSGKWLNLCAGDGRFNNTLLKKTDQVIAVDIDADALQKLVRITPDELKNKLTTQIVNVAEPLPFADETFDGIFCVGTLHLFPKEVFRNIAAELKRVLKPGGKIILDFATDIRRELSGGSLWIVENEPNYNLEEAVSFLKEVFCDLDVNISTSKVEPETVTLNDKEYSFSSNFILLEATKCD